MPKYQKVHRASVLALFLISSIASYFNPNMIYIAGLSIIGVIAHDIVCYLKEKSEPKDFSEDIEILKASHFELAGQVKDIKNDASIGKLASTFQRK